MRDSEFCKRLNRQDKQEWPFGIRDQAQDRQDKQDEKLLHRKPTRSMIGCAFEVMHELGSGFLESLLKKR